MELQRLLKMDTRDFGKMYYKVMDKDHSTYKVLYSARGITIRFNSKICQIEAIKSNGVLSHGTNFKDVYHNAYNRV